MILIAILVYVNAIVDRIYQPTYFARTTNTEQAASATTSALTEPSKIRFKPVKPRQPIAIKSAL